MALSPDKTMIALKGDHARVLRFVMEMEDLLDWIRVSSIPLVSTPAAILVRNEDVDVVVELAAELPSQEYVGTQVMTGGYEGSMRDKYFGE